jgi:hypothetical protein
MLAELKYIENEFITLFLLSFHDGEYYNYDLPRCDAIYFGRDIQCFKEPPVSSTLSIIHWYLYIKLTVSCPGRPYIIL